MRFKIHAIDARGIHHVVIKGILHALCPELKLMTERILEVDHLQKKGRIMTWPCASASSVCIFFTSAMRPARLPE